MWWNSKTQIVMKLKNSNCDETQNLKVWWNSKTPIVTKLQLWQNSKTQNVSKIKLWQNLITQIVIKLEILQISIYEDKTLNGSFSKNILTPWQLMGCSLGSVLRFSRCLFPDDKYFQVNIDVWMEGDGAGLGINRDLYSPQTIYVGFWNSKRLSFQFWCYYHRQKGEGWGN